MHETSASGPFTWFSDLIAAAAVGVTVLLAWIKDRLGINNRINHIEKEMSVLSTKMDLLIDMHRREDSEDV